MCLPPILNTKISTPKDVTTIGSMISVHGAVKKFMQDDKLTQDWHTTSAGATIVREILDGWIGEAIQDDQFCILQTFQMT